MDIHFCKTSFTFTVFLPIVSLGQCIQTCLVLFYQLYKCSKPQCNQTTPGRLIRPKKFVSG